MKSRIPIVSEVYMVWSPAWQLSAGLLWSTHSGRPDPGHFVETTAGLKDPTGTEMGNYHPQSALRDASFLLI